MTNTLTVRQWLTGLESGKSLAMGDPAQQGKVLLQASRVGEVYYVTGPLFEDYAPEVALGSLFEVGLANHDDPANVARLLNRYLSDHGVPVIAQLHVCQGAGRCI